jgi:hypothetical protein
LKILSVLLQKLDQTSKGSDFARFPYTKLIGKVGIKGIEGRIIGSLDENPKILLESGSLNHETIKQCQSSTIRSCFEPGVYIHVVFDPEDGKYTGIYIGSSNEIGPRVLAHIANYKMAREYKKGRLNSSHIKFWNRRLQVQDLWVMFGKLDKRKGESDESRGLYLNIMEIFAMLLFRSLPL